MYFVTFKPQFSYKHYLFALYLQLLSCHVLKLISCHSDFMHEPNIESKTVRRRH